MSDNHNWNLKAGAHVKPSSLGATEMALFQCSACGICATKRLTARHTGDSAVIETPDIDQKCEYYE